MRKFYIFFLTILLVIASFTGAVLSVSANTSVSTDIFAPSDYIEYCKLESPVGYCYDEATQTHVIAEASRIILYKNNLFSVHDFADKNITDVKLYDKDFLLFLSDNLLYYLNLSDWSLVAAGYKKPNALAETPLAANYFDLNGDFAVLSSGNSFLLTAITKTDSGLEFSEPSSFSKNDNHSAIAMTANDEWLCVKQNTLYKFKAAGNGDLTLITDLYGQTEYGCYHNGVYYYSFSSSSTIGVGAVNVETKEQKILLKKSESPTLGYVSKPRGLSVYGETLYVTDALVNAVSAFSLVDGEYTGFSITSRSEGAGRISESTVDLQVYGNTLYALDNDKIKSFKLSNGSDNKNSVGVKVLDYGDLKAFSVIDDVALLTNGSTVYAVNVSPEDKNTSPTLIKGNLTVPAITSFGNNFYFLHKSYENGNPCTVVYRLPKDSLPSIVLGKKNDTESKNPEYQSASAITEVAKIDGLGNDICTDIFGKIYVSITKNLKNTIVTLYDTGTDSEKVTTASEIYATPNDDLILSITTDFECNVYALLSNNAIVKITEEGVVEDSFELSVSKNLYPVSEVNTHQAKDIIVVPATNKAYALFGGFILSLDPSSLKIATPEQISVGDYTRGFESQLYLCSLKDKTRYFKVELSGNESDYFDYDGYSTYTGTDEFIVLHRYGKYALIANDNLTCIVRLKDVEIQAVSVQDLQKDMYLCFDANLYTHPVLTQYFRTVAAKEHQKVQVQKTFSFNGTAFALVNLDNEVGYIPFSMLKESVAITETPIEYKTLTVGRKGAKVYSDSALSIEVGKLEAFTDVKVLQQNDDVYQIVYNDQVCYLSASAIEPKGKTVIRNLILVSLPIVAIIITVIYIYRRKYRKSENEL